MRPVCALRRDISGQLRRFPSRGNEIQCGPRTVVLAATQAADAQWSLSIGDNVNTGTTAMDLRTRRVLRPLVSPSDPFSGVCFSYSDSFWFVCPVSLMRLFFDFFICAATLVVEEGWGDVETHLHHWRASFFFCLCCQFLYTLFVKYKFRDVEATSILFLFHATSLCSLSRIKHLSMIWIDVLVLHQIGSVIFPSCSEYVLISLYMIQSASRKYGFIFSQEIWLRSSR
jgi:hypothetical protein